MPKAIEKELEEAILGLPSKEKNKLLLRLIAKNKILVEQLHYKLLEDPEFDLKLRYKQVQKAIKSISESPTSNRLNVLLSNLRLASGQITHFKKITGDKLYETKLALYFLIMFYDRNEYFFLHSDYHYQWEKLYVYFIKKLSTLISLVDKIHEDYKIEIASDLDYICGRAHQGTLKPFAVLHKIPKTFSY